MTEKLKYCSVISEMFKLSSSSTFNYKSDEGFMEYLSSLFLLSVD